MKDTYEMLMGLGFGGYEARAYCALLDRSPANGYQVAQQSGIPRAKIYECIERLMARGAVVRVESADGGARLYAPTDPKELIDRIENDMNEACGAAREALERYQGNPGVVEVLWRVVSQQDLVARGGSLTESAAETLHVALWPEEFEVLLPLLTLAAERGVRIALVLYGSHRGIRRLQELAAGAISHSGSKRRAVPVMGRQFVLVADRERCITGSIFSEDDVEGVFTMNKGLISNAVDLVNHEIYLERMLLEVGEPITRRFGRYLGKLDAFDVPGESARGVVRS